MKKIKTLQQQLEELTTKHLGISSLNKSHNDDYHELTIYQIEKILKSVYLLGEKQGYKHGFEDAYLSSETEIRFEIDNDTLRMIEENKEFQEKTKNISIGQY